MACGWGMGGGSELGGESWESNRSAAAIPSNRLFSSESAGSLGLSPPAPSCRHSCRRRYPDLLRAASAREGPQQIEAISPRRVWRSRRMSWKETRTGSERRQDQTSTCPCPVPAARWCPFGAQQQHWNTPEERASVFSAVLASEVNLE